MRQLDANVWIKILGDLDYQSLCRFAMASKDTNEIFKKVIPRSELSKRVEWSKELSFSSLGHGLLEPLENLLGRKILDLTPFARNRALSILFPLVVVAFCFWILIDLPMYFFRIAPFILQAFTSDADFKFIVGASLLLEYISANLAMKGMVKYVPTIKNIVNNQQNLFYLIPSLEKKIKGIESPDESNTEFKKIVTNSFVKVIGRKKFSQIEPPHPMLPQLVIASKKQISKWESPGFLFHRKLLHGENSKFSDDLEVKLNTVLLEALAKLG